ncbi:family 2 glycosyl transferase [Pectobacterium brasiliense]|uniref:glycosyltransferase family 2 protein n=1 Tax=Pectobacterium brasiliense TaxID=180957 RepID=UPI0004E6AABC|nr:glycosyltransferase family 2 protein [Pectobacterium brasiliense]ARA77112.1 glycosyl transferase [Pectobacterium brasiliense]KFF61929.1 family 2 glycosyl transferase [Pectobacterium brasiliense]KHT00727.1 family 2 glycosyl transferase [Pectobacterium brasiliense]MDG0804451.1 glycosyltransferase family 2 protein [Pectobacterium brasiliense]MDY4325592.1 glycosyltransferase family 2 protein [Pectobacterium brasiliense]
MKVSIITATYNSAKTISDTLKSLNAQTYPDIEYIIIDGGSKDNTLSLIKSSCSRVSVIISEPDKGIYDALNKGILAATGDIVGFLHSDDFFAYPDAVKDIVDAMRESNADAVYGDLNYISSTDNDVIVRKWVSGGFDINKMKLGWMPPHPTFYMKRACYQRFGSFDLSYRISADYDSLLRYLWIHKVTVKYIPKVIINMRVGGMSNRSLSNMIMKTKEDVKAMKSNKLPWLSAVAGKNLSKIPQFFKK